MVVIYMDTRSRDLSNDTTFMEIGVISFEILRSEVGTQIEFAEGRYRENVYVEAKFYKSF